MQILSVDGFQRIRYLNVNNNSFLNRFTNTEQSKIW